MSEMIFAQDWSGVDATKVTERKDPIYGPVTVFHDVVIAREIVQPFVVNGKMMKVYKSADELEQYWPWVDGRWAIAGRHPSTPVIVSPGDIAGRTVNPRFVKNLIDHDNTRRPNIRGILVDLEVFNDRVTPETLSGMLDGSLPSVSIGYLYKEDMTPGNWNGSDYDFRQINMFHDHLAFGIKKGRCPFPACGIGADTLLEAKCLNSSCSNRQVKDMSITVGHDPEETEESIRIPNPGAGECEVTATITISEDQGITAAYCGESKTVRTYIFSKEKDWTMEKAQAWVDEHKEGAGDIFLTRLIELDMQIQASKRFGADMSEEEIKAKIAEIQKQIDDLYTPAPEAESEKYAEYEVLWAEMQAYTEALTELIKVKVFAQVDLSEESAEYIMCIDDEVSNGATLEEAQETCKAKTTLIEPAEGADMAEVERSKRLMKDPRLRLDPIKR